jgi:hypothetical protein
MIIPSQHASRVARAAAGGGGGGGDVTPNAVNWANVTNWAPGPVQTSMLQITGITEPITLRVNLAISSFGGMYENFNHKFSVQSTASFGTGTAIANNGTFTVSNNQYLGFSNQGFSGNVPTMYTDWTITNTSDSNTVLDTFRITTYVGLPEE